MSISQKALDIHYQYSGKIEISNKIAVNDNTVLSLVYSPGVSAPCMAIHENPQKVYDYTIKGNTVAVVSDGSAVLGLGNIGPLAAIPVMEGKAMLFKKFANIDAFPICLDTQDPDEIINIVKNIAPVFGGINLEDISAPRSFYIEKELQKIGIPVFHDDQHGTAIVCLAGLINATKVVNKKLSNLKIVINGAGAAGIAIARLLRCISIDPNLCIPVKEVIVCDSQGIIHKNREGLTTVKKELLNYSNPNNISGNLADAIVGADVFIGVSKGGVLSKEHVKKMNTDAIVFALANPTPEIYPEEAYSGGAKIVATGRSDFPNQVNNVLAFPGIFKGALRGRKKRITNEMKIHAAHAIARSIVNPNSKLIIPPALDEKICEKVAEAVMKCE